MSSNKAKEFSISKIMEEDQDKGYFFEIPPYQRLYEWEKEQIETLLEDAKKACFDTQGKPQNKIYFIGNVVASKQEKENESKYILIDGQQRLTTLFLIGVYLATRSEIKDNPWKGFIKNDKQIRISMPLRENEEKWLLDFINKQNKSDNDFKDLSKKNPNIHYRITKGLETIAEWFEKNIPKEESDDKSKLVSFAEYLYGNNETGVRFVLVELVKDTDLNQFFVRMNNRGKQLEKHEILKSRLLNIIRGENRSSGEWQKYAKIWDLCSDMDKYIFALEEDRKMFGLQKQEGSEIVIKSLQDTCDKKLYDIALKFKDSINDLNVNKDNDGDVSGVTLADIIEKSKPQKNEEKSKDAIYHSIIDFPTFLLHVFKLFTLNNDKINVPIKRDDLLKTMWENNGVEDFWEDGSNTKDFIQKLLLYRFAFDYFVIKQKASDSSYVIDWSYIESGKSNRELFGIMNSDDDLKNLVMIQNYLRVARAGERQNYHHWLTLILKEAYEILFNDHHGLQNNNDKVKKNISNIAKNLESLDTKLAYQQAKNQTETDLLMIVKQELKGEQSSDEIGKVNFDFLNKGVGTPHYWFYRLEYYLWKNGVVEDVVKKDFKIDGKTFEQIREKYRFRGLNSVEHIQPQSKAEENWQDKQNAKTRKIDCFGNLALISQSFNSSLSNQDTGDKILDLRKKINKDDVESLKLWLAYAKMESQKDNKKEWTYAIAEDHQNEMFEVLKASLENKEQNRG